MDIILLERVGKLGNLGECVTVKDGYARNFLLPQGKALRATQANKDAIAARKAQLEADNAARRSAAQAETGKIEGLEVVLIRQAGESGQLYGSVTSRDIAMAVSEKGFNVGRQQVVIDTPIKELGVHACRVQLHPEISAGIKVNVAMSADEAKAQSQKAAKAATVAEETTDDEAAA